MRGVQNDARDMKAVDSCVIRVESCSGPVDIPSMGAINRCDVSRAISRADSQSGGHSNLICSIDLSMSACWHVIVGPIHVNLQISANVTMSMLVIRTA